MMIELKLKSVNLFLLLFLANNYYIFIQIYQSVFLSFAKFFGRDNRQELKKIY